LRTKILKRGAKGNIRIQWIFAMLKGLYRQLFFSYYATLAEDDWSQLGKLDIFGFSATLQTLERSLCLFIER
jgi:hypothetical protein